MAHPALDGVGWGGIEAGRRNHLKENPLACLAVHDSSLLRPQLDLSDGIHHVASPPDLGFPTMWWLGPQGVCPEREQGGCRTIHAVAMSCTTSRGKEIVPTS